MGLYNRLYNAEPKKELDVHAPPKKGVRLFLHVLRREFWELCKLNLMMILFCIPIVTIPVAVVAMNKVLFLMLMDKSIYTFETFFSTVKAEWKRATVAGLLYFPSLAATIFGLYFYSEIVPNFLLYSCSMFACALILMAGIYLFPMLAMLDLNAKGIIKNTIILTFSKIPQNIAALFAAALWILLIVMFFPFTASVILLIFFSILILITTLCAYSSLKKIIIVKSAIENNDLKHEH